MIFQTSSQHLVSEEILAVRYEWGRKPDSTCRRSSKSSLCSWALAPVNPNFTWAGSHVKSDWRKGRKISSCLKTVINWLLQWLRLSKVSFLVRDLSSTKGMLSVFWGKGWAWVVSSACKNKVLWHRYPCLQVVWGGFLAATTERTKPEKCWRIY